MLMRWQNSMSAGRRPQSLISSLIQETRAGLALGPVVQSQTSTTTTLFSISAPCNPLTPTSASSLLTTTNPSPHGLPPSLPSLPMLSSLPISSGAPHRGKDTFFLAHQDVPAASELRVSVPLGYELVSLLRAVMSPLGCQRLNHQHGEGESSGLGSQSTQYRACYFTSLGLGEPQE